MVERTGNLFPRRHYRMSGRVIAVSESAVGGERQRRVIRGIDIAIRRMVIAMSGIDIAVRGNAER